MDGEEKSRSAVGGVWRKWMLWTGKTWCEMENWWVDCEVWMRCTE